jgi:hypothetical protein
MLSRSVAGEEVQIAGVGALEWVGVSEQEERACIWPFVLATAQRFLAWTAPTPHGSFIGWGAPALHHIGPDGITSMQGRWRSAHCLLPVCLDMCKTPIHPGWLFRVWPALQPTGREAGTEADFGARGRARAACARPGALVRATSPVLPPKRWCGGIAGRSGSLRAAAPLGGEGRRHSCCGWDACWAG